MARTKYWFKLISNIQEGAKEARSYYISPALVYKEGEVTSAPDGKGDLFLFKTLRELNKIENKWSYARVIPIGKPLKATNPKANLPNNPTGRISNFDWPEGSYLVKAVKVVKIIKRSLD